MYFFGYQFVRQTANLWVVKQQLLGADTAEIHLVDGFPMDVCVTTRARKNMIDGLHAN